jgi:hypothetical protein
VYLVNPSEELFQKSGTADEGGNDAPLFQKSGTVFQDSGTPAQISGTDLPLTSENGTPLISLSKKLSLPPVPGAPKRSSRGGHPTKKRESTAAPEGTAAPAEVVDLPAQRVEDDLLVELGQVLTAYEEARGGKTLNGTRQKILIDAAELLAAGRPLAWVIDRAKELPKFGTDLIRHAEMSRVPFTTRPVQQSLGQPVVGCASCHGSGLAEDATGMPMGPCGCITTTTSA